MNSKSSLLLILVALLLPSFLSAQATSGVPGFISYQGRVLDSAGNAVGAATPVNRRVVFRIWDHPSNTLAGNLIYSEEQTVTIADGEFSVLVGQGVTTSGTQFGYAEANKGPQADPPTLIADAFAASTRYLGVTIDDGTAAVDNEITPRQQIVASAFAFRARYAETVGTSTRTAVSVLDSGNVGVGNTEPSALLTVTGANVSTTTSNPQMIITADDTSERLRLGVSSSGNGTAFIQSFKEGIGAQFLLLNPNGGRVGIGTTSPASTLHVVDVGAQTGRIHVGGTGANGDSKVISFGDGDFVTIGEEGADDRMRLRASRFFFDAGFVGVGVENASHRLHVANGNLQVDGNATVTGTITGGNLTTGGRVTSGTQTVTGSSSIGNLTVNTNAAVAGTLTAPTLNSTNLSVSGTHRVTGMFRSGVENGTSQGPNRNGLVIRRINSSTTSAGQIVAKGLNVNLERDGTAGGLRLRFTATVSDVLVTGTAINSSGSVVGVYRIFYTADSSGTHTLFTNAQRIAYVNILINHPFNLQDSTQVVMNRFADNAGNDHGSWVGFITSTINQ